MKFRKIFLVLFLFLILFNCEKKEKYKIHYIPIKFTKIRKQLTLDYLNRRYNLNLTSIQIIPKIIVIHWTDCDLQTTFDTFMNEKIWLRGYGWSMNVSTQFIIDRDGTIYQLIPDNWMGHHCIGLNYSSIGIENVGSQYKPLTEKQLKSNIYLINYLKRKYSTINYLIGHCEYRLFEKHKLWLEITNRRTYKIDPGTKFLYYLRKYTKNLNFKKLPNNSKYKDTCYKDLNNSIK